MAAHFIHTGHQRPVNNIQGRPAQQGLIQIVSQALLAALDNCQGQPFIQGKVEPFLGGGLGRLVAEMGGKGGHRVIAPVPDEVFGHPAFLFRYRGVTLHHLRVNDRHIQPGLNAMVEENGVEHLAAGRGQAKGYVGNAQDGLGVGQGFLDETDTLDSLGGGTDVVNVAGAGGEHQGVKNNILFGYAVLLGQEFLGATGNFQLALPGDGLGLLLVVVNAADNQSRSVIPGQGRYRLEPGFTVLQVDRVNDGLALQPLEGLLNYGGVGGVNHYGTLDLLGYQVQEGQDVGHFVPVRVLQAHIQDVSAVADLAATHLGGLLKLALANEPAEAAAAQDIGPLAHDHRAGVLVNYQGLDAGNAGFPELYRVPGRDAGYPLGQLPDMLRAGAAAAANHVEPAGSSKPADGVGQHFRGLVILAVLVGQAGVGDAGYREAGQAGQGADMVGHKLRAGGAVKTNPQQVTVGQRGIKGFGVLPGQQRTHRFNRALHRHRNF